MYHFHVLLLLLILWGEITWECIKDPTSPDYGRYVFEMKVYRDCSGITFSQISQTLTHHNYPALGQTTPILLNFISITDISPDGTALSGNTCFDCSSGTLGAVEEYIWRSDPITLLGTPPLKVGILLGVHVVEVVILTMVWLMIVGL